MRKINCDNRIVAQKNAVLRRVLAAIIITFLLTSYVSVSFATESEDQLEDVKEQQEQAMNEREEIEAKLIEQQAEVERLNLLVSEKQSELDAKQIEIDAMIADITAQRNSIDDRKDGLSDRLRSMYKKGSVGFLDVLLSSSSFSEFLSNISMLQIIYRHDQDTLEDLEDEYAELKVSMARLGVAKAEIELARAELEDEKNAAAYAEAELEDTLVYIQAMLDELEAERIELEAIIEEERRQAMSSGYAYTGGSGTYIWPVSGPITSYYGYRDDPLTLAVGGTSYHQGIDIAVPVGTPVYAAAEGVVSSATGWWWGYGYAVFINHPNGTTTGYAHNSSIAVSPGEYVSQGQVIAYSGSTGPSTGPHLHFELIINGVKVDPMDYL